MKLNELADNPGATRKAKRVGQFLAFALGTLVLIRIASWLVGFAIAGFIIFLGYQIFFSGGGDDSDED